MKVPFFISFSTIAAKAINLTLVENDIFWTPSQLQELEKDGLNVNALQSSVSTERFNICDIKMTTVVELTNIQFFEV